MTIPIINRSRRRKQLLEATLKDIQDATKILQELKPGPDRWRESAALGILELAAARIWAEEDLAGPIFEARRAIEESKFE